jgi:hypothetical protein
MNMRWSREPAAWGALVVTAVSMAVVFDFPLLQEEHAAAVVALVNAVVGLVVAFRVKPFAPSAVTYVIAAAAVLAGTYGLHIHEDKVAAFNAALVGLIFAVTRLQQSPTASPGGTPEQIVSTKL